MCRNRLQFDKRMRAALQDQAKNITLSDADLRRLAKCVIHRVQRESTPPTLREVMERVWHGTTFIPWRVLFRVGAVVAVSVLILLFYISGIDELGMQARVRADRGMTTLLMEEAPPFSSMSEKGW